MLDSKLLRDNPDFIKSVLLKRGQKLDIFEEWLQLDAEYRKLLIEVENNKANQKKATPKSKPTSEELAYLQELSEKIKELSAEQKKKQVLCENALLYLPNILSEDTPEGKDEHANVEVYKWGTLPEFDFQVQSHDKIGTNLDILDFERGAKLSGSRFTVYKGMGAKLERALINFMLDNHEEKGYLEILSPVLVLEQIMQGTGQLPKFEEDVYKIVSNDNNSLYLIPTAEVSVTNLYREEILSGEALPKLFCSYSPCFRREAGSYGKDTTGLIRQHQFNKVELVIYSKPEDSMEMLEKLTLDAEDILQKLELPYKKIQLCSGDLGFSAAKTYDLEVWFPSQNNYREISSCSNCLDFQARRAKIRYKYKDSDQAKAIHTLNGSGLAVGRTLAAIIENYQQKDGSIKVPAVLKKYLKTEIINI
jgi:seryl-tRNA synthetase